MDMCVIDWPAVAAWVQAFGSIGAILVAVWIGNRQHKQNVELVEDERRRIREEQGQKAKDERAALKDSVMISLRPLHAEAVKQMEALSRLSGQTAPLSTDDLEIISVMKRQTDATQSQIEDLRDAFVSHPINLLVHTQLVRALAAVSKCCEQELSRNACRELRQAQIRQVRFNHPGNQVEPENPFSTAAIESAWQHVLSIESTVAEYK